MGYKTHVIRNSVAIDAQEQIFFPQVPTLRLILGRGAEGENWYCVVESSPLTGDRIWLRTPLYQFSLRVPQWHEKLLPDGHSQCHRLAWLSPYSVMRQNKSPPYCLCQTGRSRWHRSDWLGQEGSSSIQSMRRFICFYPSIKWYFRDGKYRTRKKWRCWEAAMNHSTLENEKTWLQIQAMKYSYLTFGDLTLFTSKSGWVTPAHTAN